MKNDYENLMSLYKKEKAKFIKRSSKVKKSSKFRSSCDEREIEAFYNKCIKWWDWSIKSRRAYISFWDSGDKRIIPSNLNVEAVVEFFVLKGFDENNLITEEVIYDDGSSTTYLNIKFS